LAEDDVSVLNLVRATLSGLGAPRVLCARDGEEALGLLARHGEAVDLIVADWGMPKMCGLQLLQHVREIDGATPFLMLTGRADAESVVRARAAGVTAYLRKPFSADQLADRYAALMQRAGELAAVRAKTGRPGPDWSRLLHKGRA